SVLIVRSSSLSGRSALRGSFAARHDGPVRVVRDVSQARRRHALRQVPQAPINARAVAGTVRLVAQRLRSAEEEARGFRITDRPSAGIIAQFEERAARAARDARVGVNSLDMGLGIDDPSRRRPFPEPPGDARCVYGPIGGARVGCGASAGRATVGRSVANAEAMNLPDDGVVGDAMAQFRGDVPYPRALRPTSTQNARALLRPRRHQAWPRRSRKAGRSLQHHASPDNGHPGGYNYIKS